MLVAVDACIVGPRRGYAVLRYIGIPAVKTMTDCLLHQGPSPVQAAKGRDLPNGTFQPGPPTHCR